MADKRILLNSNNELVAEDPDTGNREPVPLRDILTTEIGGDILSDSEDGVATGDTVDRTEPISVLSGDIYVTQKGADDPTQNDGDIWIEVPQ